MFPTIAEIILIVDLLSLPSHIFLQVYSFFICPILFSPELPSNVFYRLVLVVEINHPDRGNRLRRPIQLQELFKIRLLRKQWIMRAVFSGKADQPAGAQGSGAR